MAAVPLQDALLRHQVLIQRLSSSEVAKFKPFLKEMDRALRDAMADSSVTGLARERMEQLLSTVDTLMDGILNRYSKQLLLNLEEFARHEARFSSGALDAATTFDAVIPSITQIRAAILATPLGVKGSGRGALLKSFIENWTQTEVRGVNGTIRRGVFEGKTNQSIISELRGSHARNYQDGLLNVTSRHAEAVVRTAVQHVATVARLESFAANADIIKAYQWLSVLDKRSCPSCRSLDLRQFPADRGPRPPLHINCVPGDALVSSRYKITGVSKRPFDGHLVVIRTAGGKSLSVTANHPVLTSRGWIAAHLIAEGDDVVCDAVETSVIGDVNHQQVPARIEDIAYAFFASIEMRAMPVPTTAEDFHGDGIDGDIAIVATNRFLADGRESSLFERNCKEPLVFGNVCLPILSCLCMFATMLFGVRTAAGRIVRWFSEPLAFFRCCAIHSRLLLIRPPPNTDAIFAQDGFDGNPADAGFLLDAAHSNAATVKRKNSLGWNSALRDLSFGKHLAVLFGERPVHDGFGDAQLGADISSGHFGAVEFDNVVGIEVRKFSGHVYNLETEKGFYVANGIITHNCRCTMVPVLKDEYAFLDEGATRASKGAEGGQQVSADLSYYDWLKTQPANFQDLAIGPTRGKLLRDGGLSAERFSALQVDKKFAPMTLDEMRASDPIAFKRAGL